MSEKTEMKPHPMYKNDFKKWFMLPYLKKNWSKSHMGLKLDCSYYWNDDREFLEYFLKKCMLNIRKREGMSDACDFLTYGDLDSKCDCPICSEIWKEFEKDHLKIVCNNCGCTSHIRKDSYIFKHRKKMMKKFGKYNMFKYCNNCTERLAILDRGNRNGRR